MVRLDVNGKTFDLDVEPEMPLLWALREAAGLTGTKFGCGVGVCGACTVHLDGDAVRACMVEAGEAARGRVTTIEGLASGRPHPVQAAWIAEQVPQCGFCQSGMIMAAAALLRAKPNPTEAEIEEAMTNVCRCGTYNRVRAAIRRAAGTAL